MHINRFINFLNKYAPTSGSHEFIYDEYVEEENYSIDIETKTEKFLREELKKNNPRHIILTGNAGDGKTRLGRKIIGEIFPDRLESIKKENMFKSFSDFHKKEIIYIKDLSVFPEEKVQEILKELYDSIINNKNKIYFIAANEGKLHYNLNQLGKDYSELKEYILYQIKFIPYLSENSKLNNKFNNLLIINLNHVTNSVYIEKLIKQINKKENWKDCEFCDAKSNCIIYWNYKQLQKDYIVKKIKEIYQIIELQDIHLTFRDLLNHLAYTYTGGLYCYDIHKSIEENKKKINQMYYLNFLGDSIKQVEIFEKIFAFKYVKQLQIGEISTLKIDQLILDESQDIKEILKNEEGFGIDGFYSLKEKLKKELLEDSSKLNQWLRKLRKKLFFEYDNDAIYDLLPFLYYREYKNFNNEKKEEIRSKFIEAFNNNFSETYLYIEGEKNKEQLFLTVKIDNFSIKTAPILLKRFLEDDISIFLKKPNFEFLDHERMHLLLEINGEKLDVSLNLFDYLMRLSNGSISYILSEENDLLIKDFRDRLISKNLLKTRNHELNKYLKVKDNCYKINDIPTLIRD
ncbi:hypothetical protein [Persephonella sp. IF05-L8]|uniref:hypothetical protein n=1 Tax=Persephonella sp. IF05-L8 TaxID=1158338 RepID=UPI0004966436